ncbi:Ig-like domain-containing protein [Paraglaciecola aquimarina]|uniref:Ig-like domain-containing protein n=1 Tax=Paraglaciecola aquimarina TaxID=1235557 RepID=A0ABU3SYZ1_9ALTE|nr:Ig-like domain-containing protein [Paraglaciecola aquimarina]MDU0355137.1 Ig-like domain-containing protein [Paraglaciecola aquimarina]
MVWQSSNPSVLSINKFGEVKALKPGTATISVYSWDDAYPLAANREQTFYRNGLTADKTFTVR